MEHICMFSRSPITIQQIRENKWKNKILLRSMRMYNSSYATVQVVSEGFKNVFSSFEYSDPNSQAVIHTKGSPIYWPTLCPDARKALCKHFLKELATKRTYTKWFFFLVNIGMSHLWTQWIKPAIVKACLSFVSAVTPLVTSCFSMNSERDSAVQLIWIGSYAVGILAIFGALSFTKMNMSSHRKCSLAAVGIPTALSGTYIGSGLIDKDACAPELNWSMRACNTIWTYEMAGEIYNTTGWLDNDVFVTNSNKVFFTLASNITNIDYITGNGKHVLLSWYKEFFRINEWNNTHCNLTISHYKQNYKLISTETRRVIKPPAPVDASCKTGYQVLTDTFWDIVTFKNVPNVSQWFFNAIELISMFFWHLPATLFGSVPASTELQPVSSALQCMDKNESEVMTWGSWLVPKVAKQLGLDNVWAWIPSRFAPPPYKVNSVIQGMYEGIPPMLAALEYKCKDLKFQAFADVAHALRRQYIVRFHGVDIDASLPTQTLTAWISGFTLNYRSASLLAELILGK